MTSTIMYVFLGAAIIVLALWVLLLEIRLARIFRSGKPVSLEEELAARKRDAEQARANIALAMRRIEDLHQRVKKKIGTARTLRFNPFQGTGGNHSFASAFIDEEGDGVVISTLYSREKVSVFAKPIRKGKSEIELTEEEREVLADHR